MSASAVLRMKVQTQEGGPTLRALLIPTSSPPVPIAISSQPTSELGSHLETDFGEALMLRRVLHTLCKYDESEAYITATRKWLHNAPSALPVLASTFVDSVHISLDNHGEDSCGTLMAPSPHLVCFFLGAPEGGYLARAAFEHLSANTNIPGLAGPLLVMSGVWVSGGAMLMHAPGMCGREELSALTELLKGAVCGRYDDTDLG